MLCYAYHACVGFVRYGMVQTKVMKMNQTNVLLYVALK